MMPVGDVKRQMLEKNSDVLSKARRMRMFTHPVTCAIDCNDIEYYGKRTSKLVFSGKHRYGIFWIYRIATLCVVDKGIVSRPIRLPCLSPDFRLSCAAACQ